MNRKKTMITIMAIALIACFVMPCFGSGGQSAPAARTGVDPLLNPTGLPIAKEKVTLSFAACRPASRKNDMKDMPVFQDFERLTNVNISWIEIEEAVWNEKTRLMLASSDLPDAFWSWPIPDNVVMEYGSQGILIPLEGLIENYGHNMNRGMQEVPTLRSIMTFTDGHIYAVPMVNMAPASVQNIMWLNMEWLAQARMNVPKTTEELYNTLKTFKTLYPNTTPFTFMQYDPGGIVHYQHSARSMFGSFGVAYDVRYLMIQPDGTLVYAPSLPGYLEGLRYFNRLYAEGLLDPESFSQTLDQMTAKSKTETGVGLTISHMLNPIHDFGEKPEGYIQTIDDFRTARYQPLPPLAGPSGNQSIWMKWIPGPGDNSGRFMITNVCKHPEIALRWVDLLCDSAEHSNTVRNGPQGIGWDYVDGGRWRVIEYSEQLANPLFDPDLTNHPSNYSVWWWLPSWAAKRVMDPSVQHQIENNPIYSPFMIDPPPNVKFTPQEADRLSTIQVDLFRYTASSYTNFILNGVTNAQWNEYLTRLRNYGMDTYVQLYKTAIDRSGISFGNIQSFHLPNN